MANSFPDIPKTTLQLWHNNIIKNIRLYFKKTGFKKAVLGMSGGVDSSLCAKLAVDALGKHNIVGLLMPELGITSISSMDDAKLFASQLKIKTHVVQINPFLRVKSFPWKEPSIAKINRKARIRAMILYHYANTNKNNIS